MIDVIAPGLLVSPLLAGGALLIAVPLGVALGTFAALRRNSLWDTLVVLGLVAGTRSRTSPWPPFSSTS